MTNEKISVKHLSIGMYVCKLDRPWIETPFPFQGFYIRSQNEIRDLRAFCEHVYIDGVKGVRLKVESRLSEPSPLLRKTKKQSKYKGRSTPMVVRHDVYEKTYKPIKAEFELAGEVMEDLRYAVEQTGFNLRVGKGLDVKSTKKVASKVVQSVLRNPNTLVWLSQLKQKGQYTYGRSLKSAVLAAVFGRHIGLPEEQLQLLVTGVLLADIGKTKLPRKLLDKPAAHSEAEKILLRSHVELGVEMLASDSSIEHDILTIAETHHERFDGSGYPYGLVGNEIPVFGQIAGIVDAFDLMTSKKPFGKTITPSQAMETLFKQRNKLFGATLVDEFIQAVGLYPAGSGVQLSDGSVGVVLSHNREKRLKPKVLLIRDEAGGLLESPRFIDLSKRALFSKRDRPFVTGALEQESLKLDPDKLIAEFSGRKGLRGFLSA